MLTAIQLYEKYNGFEASMTMEYFAECEQDSHGRGVHYLGYKYFKQAWVMKIAWHYRFYNNETPNLSEIWLAVKTIVERIKSDSVPTCNQKTNHIKMYLN